MVLYIFGYPINLVLRLMDFYLGIRTRNGVYLSTYFLLFENRSLADAHRKLGKLGFTLSSALEMWGDSIFYLNLFFSIISSKSMSTFLPLWALMIFFYSFSRLASSILSRLSSLFFYIFLISSRCPPAFLSLTFIFKYFRQNNWNANATASIPSHSKKYHMMWHRSVLVDKININKTS